MNDGLIKRKGVNLSIVLFFIVYALFTIADLSSSYQSGYRDADRSTAHRFLIMVTGYLLIFLLFNLKHIVIRQPLITLLFIAIWTMIVNALFSSSLWSFLVKANMSILWVLSYLFFDINKRKEGISGNHINRLSLVLILFYAVLTVFFFFDMSNRLDRIPVLNVVYYYVALVPWISIRLSSKQKKWFFLVSMIIVVLSMKRGAIISLPLMILADYYVEGRMKGSRKTFYRVLSLLIMFVTVLIIANKLSGGYISMRFSAESLADGSGRADQFSAVLSLLKNRSLLRFLLGSGSENAVNVFGTGIHNEWLSFLFCYGKIGLISYAWLIIGFIKKSFHVFKICPELVSPCFMMTVFLFVLSIVSTGYGAYWGFWIFGFWGYINAELDIRMSNKHYLDNKEE